MGRKLEFDQGLALERAMRLFWARGYGAASVRDLLKVMDIGEGSFYHLYKSKRRLYLACLKHYSETVLARRWAVVEAEPSVKKGLRAFFRQRLDELGDGKMPPVCLMALSLSADVQSERQLQPYVKMGMAAFEASIAGRLRRGKIEGELPKGFDEDLTARILFTYLQGYYRVVRVLKNREELWKEIEGLLRRLGL